MSASRSIQDTATATLDAGVGTLRSVGITGGADAATVTVRTGGSGGTVIAKVGAGIGLSAQRNFVKGIGYTNLHATVTGTTPQYEVAVG